MAKITLHEVQEICQEALPWALDMGMTVEEIAEGTCRVRLPYREQFVRPGGTVAGPMLKGLADTKAMPVTSLMLEKYPEFAYLHA